MKKFGKWVAYVVITVILLVIIVISYVVYTLPDVGKPEDIKIALTPQRIARGEYLANNQVACMSCHSGRDESVFAPPNIPSFLGAGGEKFDKSTDFPGTPAPASFQLVGSIVSVSN